MDSKRKANGAAPVETDDRAAKRRKLAVSPLVSIMRFFVLRFETDAPLSAFVTVVEATQGTRQPGELALRGTFVNHLAS